MEKGRDKYIGRKLLYGMKKIKREAERKKRKRKAKQGKTMEE